MKRRPKSQKVTVNERKNRSLGTVRQEKKPDIQQSKCPRVVSWDHWTNTRRQSSPPLIINLIDHTLHRVAQNNAFFVTEILISFFTGYCGDVIKTLFR